MRPKSIVICSPYLCNTVFSRLVSLVSDLLVAMCSLKSSYAKVFDHKSVNTVKGASFRIISDIVMESAAKDQHLLSLQQALELLLEGE